jgi:hypothetical protein
MQHGNTEHIEKIARCQCRGHFLRCATAAEIVLCSGPECRDLFKGTALLFQIAQFQQAARRAPLTCAALTG